MFEVVIVSPVFEGKRLLARHKLVNEALKEEISKVHAFTQVSLMDVVVWNDALTHRAYVCRNHTHPKSGRRRRQSRRTIYN